MTVFVTVGSTEFDELITEINRARFREAILSLGYRHLIVQYGSGKIIPLPSEAFDQSGNRSVAKLATTIYKYKQNLSEDFDAANLIISHGGAGTCLEALTPPGQRRLVIVVNPTLMNNHQMELAGLLARRGHAVVTQPTDVLEVFTSGYSSIDETRQIPLKSAELKNLLGNQTSPTEAGFKPFYREGPAKLINFLDKLVGFDVLV